MSERSDRRLGEWIVLALTGAMLLVALAAGRVRGQDPNPPTPPLPLAGKWTMTWSGGDAPATFHAQGGYECVWIDGTSWYGEWSLSGCALTVKEFQVPPAGKQPEAFITWEATLKPGTRKGVLDQGGGDFNLVKR